LISLSLLPYFSALKVHTDGTGYVQVQATPDFEKVIEIRFGIGQNDNAEQLTTYIFVGGISEMCIIYGNYLE